MTATTTVSYQTQNRRLAPYLATAAVAGLIAAGVVAGVALHDQSASPITPDPPAVSYPGSDVFDNQPAVPDPPVASYPGSGVFDNQPAASWWTHSDDLKHPGRSF